MTRSTLLATSLAVLVAAAFSLTGCAADSTEMDRSEKAEKTSQAMMCNGCGDDESGGGGGGGGTSYEPPIEGTCSGNYVDYRYSAVSSTQCTIVLAFDESVLPYNPCSYPKTYKMNVWGVWGCYY